MLFVYTCCLLKLLIQLFLILSGCSHIGMQIHNNFTNANSHRHDCISDKVGRSVGQSEILSFPCNIYGTLMDFRIKSVGRSVGHFSRTIMIECVILCWLIYAMFPEN